MRCDPHEVCAMCILQAARRGSARHLRRQVTYLSQSIARARATRQYVRLLNTCMVLHAMQQEVVGGLRRVLSKGSRCVSEEAQGETVGVIQFGPAMSEKLLKRLVITVLP